MSIRERDTGAAREAPAWHRVGIGLALVTAVVSGIAVFVNGYGVRRFDDATVYTTAKNLVAGLVLVGLASVATVARSRAGLTRPASHGEILGLVFVAVVGGAVAFVAFFEGLARVSSTDAAFIHKTLVVWVALGAAAVLRERLTGWHVLAVAVLVLGQAELSGGVGWPDVGSGEVLVLAATVCWAIEVLVAKRLLTGLSPLTVGTARMAGGSVVLVAWLAVSGRLGDLAGLAPSQWAWALLTGALLTAYVVSWHHALAAAPAIDVTAVLVLGAVITALLGAVVDGTDLAPVRTGLVLIGVGTAIVVVAARRTGSRRRVAPA